MNTKDIPMPRIDEAEDIEEFTLVAWLKKTGEEISEGEVIAEAMTEKANVEILSPETGVLEEILVEEDEAVKVGQPIARLSLP